jgi:hypothetical protein
MDRVFGNNLGIYFLKPPSGRCYSGKPIAISYMKNACSKGDDRSIAEPIPYVVLEDTHIYL